MDEKQRSEINKMIWASLGLPDLSQANCAIIALRLRHGAWIMVQSNLLKLNLIINVN